MHGGYILRDEDLDVWIQKLLDQQSAYDRSLQIVQTSPSIYAIKSSRSS
ncbi:unnamed protein product [Brassica rapa subsp. trilocularis]